MAWLIPSITASSASGSSAGLRQVTATLTAAAAGDYSANDVVSNDATDTQGDPITFSSIAKANGNVVELRGVTAICSEDSVVFRLRMHFFNDTPAAAEVEMDDNAAFAITTSTDYLGYVDLPAFADVGGVSVTQNHSLNMLLKCASASSNLFVVLQTLDAETNETASMTIRFDLYVL